MRHYRFFKFLEKKDHLINKLSNLTSGQKQEAIAFFAKHPNYESEIDWNRKDLSWEDFEKVINKPRLSKSQIKKSVKRGIRGLEEGFDYLLLSEGNFKGAPYSLYQPLTWKGSRVLASDQVEPKLHSEDDENLTGAKWCISYQKNKDYWDSYIGLSEDSFKKPSVFLIVAGEEIESKKIAVQIKEDTPNKLYKDSSLKEVHIALWDSKDNIKASFTIHYRANDLLSEILRLSYYDQDVYDAVHMLPEEVFTYIETALDNKDLCLKNSLEEDDILSEKKIGHILEESNYNQTHVLDIPQKYISYVASSSNMKKYFIKDGKFKYNFGTIEGDFNCYNCKELRSLEGAPRIVKGTFCIQNTPITSLKGCPEIVEEGFDISYCSKLTTLDQMPSKIGTGFSAWQGALQSLEGLENTYIGKSLIVSGCPIKSLKGIPKNFSGVIQCLDTPITSLEGCPQELEVLNINFCDNLKSLKWKPRVIKNFISFESCNNLEDLHDDYKTKVEGLVYYSSTDFSEEEIDRAFDYDRSDFY